MVCRDHPQRSARRKCFSCKSPICPACQFKTHHHIFCGTECAEKFERFGTQNETSAEQKIDPLEALDQSLQQDLKDHSEDLSERVHQEFQKLEDELDQALTALAAMVEGASVANSHEVEAFSKETKTSLETAARLAQERATHAVDDRAQLRQLVLSIRSLILDERENVKQLFVEQTGRIASLETSLEELEKRNQSNTREATETILEQFETYVQKDARDLSTNVLQHQVQFNKFFAEQAKQIHELQSHVSKELQLFSDQVNAKVSDRIQKVVDDIASLTVAHRGNWNEVLKEARLSSNDTKNQLGKEVQKRLVDEVAIIAKDQSRAMGLVISDLHAQLKKQVRKESSPWARRALFAATGTAFLMMISFPLLLIRTERKHAEQLEKAISRQEQGIKSWLTEKLALLAPKGEEKRAVPKVTAVTRGNLHRKEFAFTFDGGSNARAALEILDALKKHQLRGTMFLTGEFIQKNPEIAKKIAIDGHEVGNHLLHHNHLIASSKDRENLVTKEEFLAQLRQVEELYEKTTGQKMTRYWRAPYGEVNSEILEWASSLGYTHIGWTRSGRNNLDTLDWVADRKHPWYRTADQIAGKILEFEKTDRNGLNGALVLMHLGTERTADYPHQRLSSLLEQLKKKGYRNVTVSEVLRSDLASR